MENHKGDIKTMTGNAAAAYGAMLCRPDVVALYPITPQTEVVEQLSRFHADGLLDAEMVEAEGENSVMNIVTGATMAGARVFTATSSWGLAFMYDALLHAAGFRAPVVMVNVNREMPGILAVSAGQQDMVATRDTGWIQVIAEDCQEILDMIIMAYRLAEDYEIQLPVMVNYDGFYLSFLAEGVHLPAAEDVDRFLAPLKEQPERPKLIPGRSLGCGTHGIDRGFVELRYKHCAAMERAKTKFDGIDSLFEESFGRGYGGQIEEYRMSDADIALIISGSATGTAKTVVDAQREAGHRVGLVKIRMFRPFPQERLIQALRGKKALGVVDRSICFGWNSGPTHMELRAIRSEIGTVPILGFVGGLANMDLSTMHFEKIVDRVYEASRGAPYEAVTWLGLEE